VTYYNRWNEFDMGLILAMERMEISTAGNVFDMEQSLLPAAGKLLSSCQVFKKNPLL